MNVKQVCDLAGAGLGESADDSDDEALRAGQTDEVLHALGRGPQAVVHGPQRAHEPEDVSHLIWLAGRCIHGHVV
jgi:hypothetical protein